VNTAQLSGLPCQLRLLVLQCKISQYSLPHLVAIADARMPLLRSKQMVVISQLSCRIDSPRKCLEGVSRLQFTSLIPSRNTYSTFLNVTEASLLAERRPKKQRPSKPFNTKAQSTSILVPLPASQSHPFPRTASELRCTESQS
jgi:hypothetical protein